MNIGGNTMLKTILRAIECTAILGLLVGFVILDYLFGGDWDTK